MQHKTIFVLAVLILSVNLIIVNTIKDWMCTTSVFLFLLIIKSFTGGVPVMIMVVQWVW